MSITFNPFTGNFDFTGSNAASGADNFSYKTIPDGETVVIPENQQMLVDGQVLVQGHLSVLGDLVDISGRQKEQFFYDLITADDVVTVEPNRLLMYKDHVTVLGHLRVLGRLAEV